MYIATYQVRTVKQPLRALFALRRTPAVFTTIIRLPWRRKVPLNIYKHYSQLIPRFKLINPARANSKVSHHLSTPSLDGHDGFLLPVCPPSDIKADEHAEIRPSWYVKRRLCPYLTQQFNHPIRDWRHWKPIPPCLVHHPLPRPKTESL